MSHQGLQRLARSRGLQLLLVLIVCGRVAGVTWSGRVNNRGDFYASLPGTYVQSVNPTLWTSPDLKGAMGYELNTYYHGPTQYLTLYPIAYFDSYEQIADFLLVAYAIVLAVAFWFLYRSLVYLAPGSAIALPLFAMTFLFFPLLQSYLQREFEVIVFLGLTFALWQLQANRYVPAGLALGYIAFFKYIPLLFLGYLGLRSWLAAVAAFLVATVLVLLATQWVFGLPEFFNNNVPGHAAQVFNVSQFGFTLDAAGELQGHGFCTGWFEIETTLANVRHGLCALASTRPWLAPNLIYLAICVAVAAAYLLAHYRLSRGPRLAAADEAWRRALEFSVVTTVCACFFFAHYYYLIVLVIPYGVLLVRYLDRQERPRLVLWGASYVLVSAFVVPTGPLSRLVGVDVWAWYFRGSWFLYGQLLLMGLLLYEYSALASRREPAAIS